jgi:hypothetical protein
VGALGADLSSAEQAAQRVQDLCVDQMRGVQVAVVG